jgi:hypothetical protein
MGAKFYYSFMLLFDATINLCDIKFSDETLYLDNLIDFEEKYLLKNPLGFIIYHILYQNLALNNSI